MHIYDHQPASNFCLLDKSRAADRTLLADAGDLGSSPGSADSFLFAVPPPFWGTYASVRVAYDLQYFPPLRLWAWITRTTKYMKKYY